MTHFYVSQKKILLAASSSILSVGVHLYLTLQHYSLKLGFSTGQSFCNINSRFNCDAVAMSSYSSLGKIPIALWGVLTHLALAVILSAALLEGLPNRNRILRYSYVLSLWIAIVSIFMGGIATFKLGAFCIFCIIAYLLSFITVYFTYQLVERHLVFSSSIWKKDFLDLFYQSKWVLILFIFIPVLSYLSHFMILDQMGMTKMDIVISESINLWRTSPTNNFDINNGLKLKSPKALPTQFQIVEFADYLCPHCRLANNPLHSFVASHPTAELIFKAFPLDESCNPAFKNDSAPNEKETEKKPDGLKCLLAYSVYCAEKLENKGWKMHHIIFERQETLSNFTFTSLLKEFSEILQINFEKIQECTQSSEARDAIKNQASEGVQAQIKGTPTIFVNGKLLERGQFLPLLEELQNQVE